MDPFVVKTPNASSKASKHHCERQDKEVSAGYISLFHRGEFRYLKENKISAEVNKSLPQHAVLKFSLSQ